MINMEGINIQNKPCKIYFSDGYVEIIEVNETDLPRGKQKTISDKPKNWLSRLLKHSKTVGTCALNTVDYLGGSLANFFGITTPKYQYIINHHNKIVQKRNAKKVSAEEKKRMNSVSTKVLQ